MSPTRRGLSGQGEAPVRCRNQCLSGHGDWQGKAGAYAIQGPAGAFIPWISGSFTGIVGLPCPKPPLLLQGIGYPLYREVS